MSYKLPFIGFSKSLSNVTPLFFHLGWKKYGANLDGKSYKPIIVPHLFVLRFSYPFYTSVSPVFVNSKLPLWPLFRRVLLIPTATDNLHLSFLMIKSKNVVHQKQYYNSFNNSHSLSPDVCMHKLKLPHTRMSSSSLKQIALCITWLYGCFGKAPHK